MWISFNLDDMLFKLKIERLNNTNDYLDVSFEYQFKNIINYKKYNQKILLHNDIDIIKNKIKELLDNKLKNDDIYYCYEPDFNFEFIGGKWLTINTYLWNNDERIGQITNNKISITLELNDIRQLYLYLKLITNEIDLNDNEIKKLINNNTIYNEKQG